MRLSKLLEYENIIVQCHDNPDADALASGMALELFLKKNKKNVRFVYGGRYRVQKSNLLLMIKELGINVHYVDSQEELNSILGLPVDDMPDLLVTVDCQYGEGNVTKFQAKKTAVIDHHQISRHYKMAEIRPIQASCSTIIWDMLKREGFDPNLNSKLATALYYGLMTDSSNFTEVHHPLDRDMLDALEIQKGSVIKFKNANISQNELKIAGLALLGYEYYKKYRYAIVRTEPCDPNILGVISDMLLEVDSVDACLVYNVSEAGVKISVRSCTIEVKANEFAEYIAEGIGNGGGHLIKAGGFLNRKFIEKLGVNYEQDAVHDFLRDRVNSYFENTQIIYANKHKEDVSVLTKYKKKAIPLGYVKCNEFLKVGTKATVRTLEGDVDVEIKNDTIIMIGILGEIYPVNEKFFMETNELSDEKYEFKGEYEPSVKDVANGTVHELIPHAKTCISKGSKVIYARVLENRVKVFTNWDKEKYYLGKPGDYLAFVSDNPNDIYVIGKDIFKETYEEI